jgi:RNA polymerase sigma factor (sigma-70 family)
MVIPFSLVTSFSTAGHDVSAAIDHVLPVVCPNDPVTGKVDAALTRCARAAKAGNLDARNALYLALLPKLLQQTRRIRPWMLPQSWDRSDLEQEAFEVFVQLLDAWRGDTMFGGYLLGHFSWRLRNVVRRAREQERLPSAHLEIASFHEDDSWEAEESRLLLEDIAATFPPLEREILLGRIGEGEGFGALAHRLGLSRRTVYRHWIIILIELRKSFGIPLEISLLQAAKAGRRRPLALARRRV